MIYLGLPMYGVPQYAIPDYSVQMFEDGGAPPAVNGCYMMMLWMVLGL